MRAVLREITVKINVLRNGAVRGILRAIGTPSVRMEENAEVRTTLRGSFEREVRTKAGGYTEFNQMLDELQPVLTVNGEPGSLGRFLPVTAEENGGLLEIEGFDRCWRIQRTVSGSRVFFPAGMMYLEAVEQLLTAAGITNMRVTVNTAVLTEDREEWDLGTDNLTIINKLLGEINYQSLWFDATGAAVIEPKRTPSAANIRHVLDSDKPETLLLRGIRRKKDLYGTPNVIIAVCDNPDKSETMTARAVNNNPASPLSVQRCGREIVQVEHVDNIAGQEELQAWANRRIFETMTTGETIYVSTGIQAGWGVGDVVGLHYKPDALTPDQQADGSISLLRPGEEINCLCVSRAWEMDLEPGAYMSHTLEKVVYVLG